MRAAALLAVALAAVACAAAPVAGGPMYPPERDRVLEGIEVRLPPEIGWRTNPIDVALPIMRRGDRQGFEIVAMSLYSHGVDLCREHPRLMCGPGGPVWLVRVRGTIVVRKLAGSATFASAYFIVCDGSNHTVAFGAPDPLSG